HPPGVEALPVLTRPRAELPRASGAIDRAVREILNDALAIYAIEIERLRLARPDVVVTQDLCDVCAVSIGDVRRALAELARADVEVVILRPTRLQDVWNDVRRVGKATGRAEQGEEAAAELERRVDAIAARASVLDHRPSVLTIEWLDPVMIGGTWMPELVALAGGTPLVTEPGQLAPTLDLDALSALDPDVVLIKPCGFDLEHTTGEIDLLRSNLPWERWTAVREGRVFIADGNAYFNRPGPRLVESLEILAALAHPDAFADLAEQHAAAMLRVTPEGAPVSFEPR
ncbi:MAG: ABC transporter substrate-binding protein, partial [Planctomycetota bacterium]|nr:ABC transporter substrate-binding protein [Planctomycetota bacterium]